MQGPNSSSQQLSALSVLLEQPDIASDPLLLCSTARVCSSWRAAVAASNAGTTDIIIRDSSKQVAEACVCDDRPDLIEPWAAKYILCWAGFDCWVVHHAHLIKSMRISGIAGRMAYLKLLLHTAVCGTVHLPSLQQLSCDFLPGSAGKFLAAVTGSLTQLRITPEQEEDEDPPPGGTDVLARAVNRLTSLKCLQLGRYCCSREVLLALRELTCLTQLKLCDRYTSVRDAEYHTLSEALPCLTKLEVLHVLDVYWDLEGPNCWKVTRGLALGGLTALKQLWLGLECGFTGDGVVLPAGLTELILNCGIFCGDDIQQHMASSPLEYLQLRSLANLRHLTVKLYVSALEEFPDAVQTLAKLQQLDRLDLVYESMDSAYDDCEHWPSCPALSRISISNDDVDVEGELDCRQMQEGILSVMLKLRETLTRLDFEVWHAGHSCETVSICKHVSGLSKLQRLCLNPFFGEPAAQDCMQLSGLRSLTHLDLCHMGKGVDDAVAAALVGNMPQLRQLALYQCEATSVMVPPDCQLKI